MRTCVIRMINEECMQRVALPAILKFYSSFGISQASTFAVLLLHELISNHQVYGLCGCLSGNVMYLPHAAYVTSN